MVFPELILNTEQELEGVVEKESSLASFELVKKEKEYFWKGTKKPAIVEHIYGEKTHNLSRVSEFWKENPVLFAENFVNTHFHHVIKSLPPKMHVAYHIKSRTAEKIIVEYMIAREQ